jgi:hypothetical protein
LVRGIKSSGGNDQDLGFQVADVEHTFIFSGGHRRLEENVSYPATMPVVGEVYKWAEEGSSGPNGPYLILAPANALDDSIAAWYNSLNLLSGNEVNIPFSRDPDSRLPRAHNGFQWICLA